MAIAGWYPDPQDQRSEQYWDGAKWTGQRRAPQQAQPDAAQLAAAQREQAQREQAQREQAQREQAERERSEREQAERERSEREQAERERSEREQAQRAQERAAAQPYPEPAAPYQETRVNPVWRNQPAATQPPGPGQPQPEQGQPQAGAVPAPGYAPAAGYGQQSPGYGQNPGYGQSSPYVPGAAPGYGQNQPWQGQPTGTPPKRRKKGLLIAAGVVVVLVAAGLITWLALPDSKPSITYQGKSIASPADVLTAAEKTVDSTVSSQHGVKNSDTRCYYAKPKTAKSGTKSSDVDSSLRCGPVLFVDGNKANEYLTVPLKSSSASGGKVQLTAPTSLDDVTLAAISSDTKLVRPDDATPPAGNGGLSVPQPPPAADNTLLATSLGSSTAPQTLSGATMTSKTVKVTLIAAGAISRYGSGSTARSAPKGGKLYAFQVQYGEGESSLGDTKAQVVVGGSARAIPAATGDTWDVVAVPASTTASIQLTDSGYKQTLSLPAGTPGSSNIQVLNRVHRTDILGKSFSVPVRLSKGGSSRDGTFRASATIAFLDFWPPINESLHPQSPANAFLGVRVTYTFSATPGTFGFDTKLLSLRLPSGRTINARNLAPSGKISNVFEVPANFTRGTVVISGSEVISGVLLQITRTRSFGIAIPAG